MKNSGTLKVEIIKPVGELTWKELGARLRVLSSTLPMALNLAFRDMYPHFMATVDGVLDKPSSEKGRERLKTARKAVGQNNAEQRLRHHWNARIEASKAFRKGKKVPVGPECDPVKSLWSAHTSEYLTAPMKAGPFKEFLGGRRALPSFGGNRYPIWARADACKVDGRASSAVLHLPLWGSGDKATPVAVAPCGGSACVLWERLTRQFPQRAEIAKLSSSKDAADAFALEERRALKLGKVGVKYDQRRGKWYALISWTEHKPTPSQEGQAAACNFGARHFLYAMSSDGGTHADAGSDIVNARERFSARRRSLSRAKNFMGSGSRGHGKRRRELPLTSLADKESRWVQDRIRWSAAELVKWCARHNVTTLYLEKLGGIRDAFEAETEGEAHPALKRLIHQWPFYETQQALAWAAEKRGIKVEFKQSILVSQRCPSCGHWGPENLRCENRGGDTVELRRVRGGNFVVDRKRGDTYRKVAREWWFECERCGLTKNSDAIACANHLLDVGETHSLERMNEKSARKRGRIKSSVTDREEDPVAAAE